LLLNGIFAQGNFQILNIPPSTRLLSLSNSGHAANNASNSHNAASIKTDYRNINFQSHFYPANIIYIKSELVLPMESNIYSLEYSNLNYGKFKDAESNYSFNVSEFLLKGSIKTEILDKISIGGGLGYSVNKISNQFAHALFISLGARTQIFNPLFGVGISINNFGIITKNFYDKKEELPEAVILSTFYQPIYFPGVLYCDIYKEKSMDDVQIRLGLESTIYKNIILRFGYNSNIMYLADSHSSYLKGLSGGIGVIAEKWDVDIGFYNLETAGIISSISLTYKQ